jgi:hypothetical protein
VASLLEKGHRVLAVDLCFFGELHIARKPDFIPADFMVAISTVGERPLGVQAGQLAGIARWLLTKDHRPARVVALGPRSSLIATVAAGIEAEAIGELELHQAFGSLKEIIENNLTAEHAPEIFCFGLLEAFDMPQLAALVAPRPIEFRKSSERLRTELAPIGKLYASLGVAFNPAQ